MADITVLAATNYVTSHTEAPMPFVECVRFSRKQNANKYMWQIHGVVYFDVAGDGEVNGTAFGNV